MTPAQPTRYPPAAGWPVGGHHWGRGAAHPKGWVLPLLAGKCPLPPPLRGVFICEVILKCKKINREQMGQGARAAPSPAGPLWPCWENTAAGEANGFQTCGKAGTCGRQDAGPDPAEPW